MQIGDRVAEKPYSMATDKTAEAGRETYWGEVVYIHPQGRFHVTEFQVASGKIRETFFDGNRAANPAPGTYIRTTRNPKRKTKKK